MKKNELLTLEIEEISNLGVGIAHTKNPDGSRGQVVFVRDGVTGDRVEAQVIKATKSYLVAKINRILTPSPLRCDNDCTARGCGGCVYRHIGYEHELEMKRAYVQAAFHKMGLPEVEVEAVRSTGELIGYRNKAQYPVGVGKNGMIAGFYAASSHRIVSAEACRLQPAIFREIVDFLCDFCTRHGISAYDETTRRGLLRHIYLRIGAATGEIMVCLVVNGKALPHEDRLTAELTRNFPAVVSVMLNCNTADTNVVLGEAYRCLGGRDFIEDHLCGKRFAISAGAFYQVNHNACELLYALARERAALTGNETLIDLYCGIGTIGLSMGDAAGEVIGIEIVGEAVQRAAENAARNGMTHAHFYCGDATEAERLLENAERSRGPIDPSRAVVILDPPRKGSTRELIEYLSARNFGRVVYISCNPDTLARDCKIFRECGYAIGKVTPVDLFPRTGHVESVCLLCKAT